MELYEMTVREEYIPENNLVVLLLLVIFTAGLYYFWWLVRMSRMFHENPVSNVVLTIFTAGLWGVYVNLRYMQKSEEINGRDMKWLMVLFVFFPVVPMLIIQNNINEKYFPGR
jgi:uncharacterized membrane protein YjgN (DUF898 family)